MVGGDCVRSGTGEKRWALDDTSLFVQESIPSSGFSNLVELIQSFRQELSSLLHAMLCHCREEGTREKVLFLLHPAAIFYSPGGDKA